MVYQKLTFLVVYWFINKDKILMMKNFRENIFPFKTSKPLIGGGGMDEEIRRVSTNPKSQGPYKNP